MKTSIYHELSDVVSSKFIYSPPSPRIYPKVSASELIERVPLGYPLMFDMEVYSNLTLASFKPAGIDIAYDWVLGESSPNDLRYINDNFKQVGWNLWGYDRVMVVLAIMGYSSTEIKRYSDNIIVDKIPYWDLGIDLPMYENYIDLLEVAPERTSLKLMAARFGAESIIELPIDPAKVLTPQEKQTIIDYCSNDLYCTEVCYDNMIERVNLRRNLTKEQGTNLMSKSDVKIAEAVLKKRASFKIKKSPVDLSYTFNCTVPEYVSFSNPDLVQLMDDVQSCTFSLSRHGHVVMPDILKDRKIKIGDMVYSIGIGGLHSTEKSRACITTETVRMKEADVTSYYPYLMINAGSEPLSFKGEFIKIYKSIVEDRVSAKLVDKARADGLKITINGTYGLTSSIYSPVYAPKLTIDTTLGGQLSLLMLIEGAEYLGIPVMSANTDGVVFACPHDKADTLDRLYREWETATKLNLEETTYTAIYSRDVNNFIALKTDGSFKVKGCYGKYGGKKNPQNYVVTLAIMELIKNGTSVDEFIRNHDNILDFLTVRKVAGGAEKDGQLLGKIVRYYYSNVADGTFTYVKSGNNVPATMGAVPALALPPSIPDDLDYDKYIDITNDVLYKIGYLTKRKYRFLDLEYDYD